MNLKELISNIGYAIEGVGVLVIMVGGIISFFSFLSSC